MGPYVACYQGGGGWEGDVIPVAIAVAHTGGLEGEVGRRLVGTAVEVVDGSCSIRLLTLCILKSMLCNTWYAFFYLRC
jgi:hypothetical protein